METNGALADRYRGVTLAAVLGLGLNLGLAAAKLIGGIAANSFALIADAVNSLGDVAATLAVLFALQVARRPADARHPYGYARAEGIAASNVALVIIISALAIGWGAIQRLTVDHSIPPIWTLWLAGTNIVIKEWLYQYKMRVGRRTGSAAIIANAWDHRSDAFCSLAVLVGLGVIRLGGKEYIWADDVASLFVVAAIVWSGIQLFRQSAGELMDAQASDEFVRQIEQVAEGVADVRAVETLWVRKAGLEYFADIHFEVDQHLSVAEGHLIGHRVKDQLMKSFPSLRDVLVHLEPYLQSSERGAREPKHNRSTMSQSDPEPPGQKTFQ